MIVVTLTDCPPRLRGDLSKWLLEINTGVYVGQVNARVREELWKRICENLPRGRATMVYSANNEQRMAFHIHNTTWQPVDYEGLTLIRRPAVVSTPEERPKAAMSNAAVNQMTQRKKSAQVRKEKQEGYVVIDIETTGLDCETDEILEVAAVRIVDHEVTETFSVLICPQKEIPKEITAMTGITREMLLNETNDLPSVLERFWDFVGHSPVVGHNLRFDRSFLEKASEQAAIAVPRISYWDTLTLARRRIRDVPDHRLSTLADYFEVEHPVEHRALADCLTTFQVYEKLNEI